MIHWYPKKLPVSQTFHVPQLSFLLSPLELVPSAKAMCACVLLKPCLDVKEGNEGAGDIKKPEQTGWIRYSTQVKGKARDDAHTMRLSDESQRAIRHHLPLWHAVPRHP